MSTLYHYKHVLHVHVPGDSGGGLLLIRLPS